MADEEQIKQSASLARIALRVTEEGFDEAFGEGYSEKHKGEMVKLAGTAALDYRLAKIESCLLEISKKLDR